MCFTFAEPVYTRESQMQVLGRFQSKEIGKLKISMFQHPPQHLKDQLLANGKQNLVMKNLISQQITHQHQSAAMPALAQIVVGFFQLCSSPQKALSIDSFNKHNFCSNHRVPRCFGRPVPCHFPTSFPASSPARLVSLPRLTHSRRHCSRAR